ncbi:hypothetical protein PHMEG_0009505 [Phytophthora megakarya]|uniref:FLYWCH-type domain-containing protein n=1 Tax=Phytophthora megakarya TaxID=4795 RepID=A0A225WHG5_9STRA|nr:hypothetical protein PHMEG_0009505 [Phytophthora megakarya]
MRKLRTLKQTAKLRSKTLLAAVIRQDTRWSSTFSMLKHYYHLREFISHRVARHNAKTVITVNGYPFSRYHKSSIKLSFRCSSFRSSKCTAKVYFSAGASKYDLVGEHTCSARFDARSPVTDVSAGMCDVTDMLAETDMSIPPEEIWRLVRERFYLGNADEVLLGLTREQGKPRVHRVRHTHYGGNYHGVVEVPPLSLTSVGGFPFFKFHQVYMDGVDLERVIGWAHPVLHERPKCKNSSLLIDGTFRCVPHGF